MRKINTYSVDEPNHSYLIIFLSFFGSLDDPLNGNLCNSNIMFCVKYFLSHNK